MKLLGLLSIASAVAAASIDASIERLGELQKHEHISNPIADGLATEKRQFGSKGPALKGKTLKTLPAEYDATATREFKMWGPYKLPSSKVSFVISAYLLGRTLRL
jgi:hypothetical protein